MRIFFVGDRKFRNQSISYYVLVEDLDSVGENYGIRVAYGEEEVSIPGITVS